MSLALLTTFSAAVVAGWVYTHTDEIPVDFAVLGVLALVVAYLFPRFWAASALALGLVFPVCELLIARFHLPAPFPGGHPFEACVGLIPGFFAAGLGRFLSQWRPARLQ